MKERIIEFLKAENKSSAVFAEEIGVQPSGISHILSGRNNPSLDFILKMLKRYPSLSTDWLLFGKGEMLIEAGQQDLFGSGIKQSEDSFNKQLDIELDNDNKGISPPSAPDTEHQNPLPGEINKHTVRIVYFFSDSTFKEYFPNG